MIDTTPSTEEAAQIKAIREAYDLLHEADSFRRSGDLPKARAICENLTKHYPGYWAAQHTLGLIYSDLKMELQALACFVSAAQVNPSNILSLTGLAGAYLALDSFGMVRGVLDQAQKLSPDDPNILFLYGEMLIGQHQYQEAADAYGAAYASDPTMASAVYKWGLCALALDDVVTAARLFVDSLRIDPSAFGPLSELAALPPDLIPFDLQARLEASKGPLALPEIDAFASLSFAKASACHVRGHHAQAWKHAVDANRAAYPSKKMRAQEISNAQRNSLIALSARRTAANQIPPKNPTLPTTLLILGCSRSGKTTIEKLLGNWASVQKGHESSIIESCLRRTMLDAGLLMPTSLKLLPKELHAPYRENYFSALVSRNKSASVFTNTNPFLISEAIDIINIIPNIQIICIKRNVADTVFSIYMRDYRTANEYAYDLNDIREHVLWYHEMIDKLATLYPAVVQIHDYDDLICDTARLLNAIASQCGIDDRPPVGDFRVHDGRSCALHYIDFMQTEAAHSRNPNQKP